MNLPASLRTVNLSRKRVVTGTDIDNFAVMTGAVNPLFLKDEVGKEVGYKARIAPGALTLSLSIGLQYGSGLFDHLIAFKGIDKLSFLAPVHPGDIIWCEAEVIDRGR